MLIPTKKTSYKDITIEQPKFDTLNIDGGSLRAALLFAAKNDIRYYLNGIYLDNRGFIVATNGHTLIRIECDECKRLSESLILSIKGAKIPAKTMVCDFISLDCKGGIIKLGRVFPGDLGEVREFEVVEAKYPDVDKVIPSGALVATDKIGINPDYMKLVGDAQKILGHGKSYGAIFKFRGAMSVIEIELVYSVNAKIIIMSCTI